MFLQVCLVTDRRSHLNVVRTSVTHLPNASCAIFLFLLHFVVIHDLLVLLSGHMATWNVFVKIC